MLSFADHRAFSLEDDRFQRCMFCGKELVVLPNDRRGGACFDCLSLDGSVTRACPECGEEIVATRARLGCSHCGWLPARD